jgi:hypothetical protein
MRLSEAIRLGSMLRPQGFGHMWSGGKSCAVGAAYEALGYGDGKDVFLPRDLYDLLISRIFLMPCGCTPYQLRFSLVTAITHLNDAHRWTRERIADWVETLERTASPEAANAVPRCEDEQKLLYQAIQ